MASESYAALASKSETESCERRGDESCKQEARRRRCDSPQVQLIDRCIDKSAATKAPVMARTGTMVKASGDGQEMAVQREARRKRRSALLPLDLCAPVDTGVCPFDMSVAKAATSDTNNGPGSSIASGKLEVAAVCREAKRRRRSALLSLDLCAPEVGEYILKEAGAQQLEVGDVEVVIHQASGGHSVGKDGGESEQSQIDVDKAGEVQELARRREARRKRRSAVLSLDLCASEDGGESELVQIDVHKAGEVQALARSYEARRKRRSALLPLDLCAPQIRDIAVLKGDVSNSDASGEVRGVGGA